MPEKLIDIEGGEAGASAGPSASSSKSEQQKLDKLKAHVDEVSGIMSENIKKILDRGDKLDTLEGRSENLAANSDIFRTSSRRVARKMWWQNAKVNLFIGLIVAVIVAIIIYVIARS